MLLSFNFVLFVPVETYFTILSCFYSRSWLLVQYFQSVEFSFLSCPSIRFLYYSIWSAQIHSISSHRWLCMSISLCVQFVHCTCRFVWIALRLYLCVNNVNKWMDFVSQTNVKHKNMLTHTHRQAFTSTELTKCIIMHVTNATCFMPSTVCAFPSNEFAIFYTWCQPPSLWRERERKKPILPI